MYLITSDSKGNIAINKRYRALGRSGKQFITLEEQECSILEEPAYLVRLPHREALGVNNIPIYGTLAVAGIPAHGFTRTLLPAYQSGGQPPWLPFFAFSAAGGTFDKIYIAALRTEYDIRWDYSQYNSPDLKQKIKAKLKLFPSNRILKHLSRCALNYRCFTAQNLFYGRWEAGIPVSPTCNAKCLGCISAQKPGCPAAPQQRINFVPQVSEIAELGIEHLKDESSIISFGQGCEGEPLLQHKILQEALLTIRAKTHKGSIHINTNGSLPKALQGLLKAGLNSVRISINSALPQNYENYFQPQNYKFADLLESLKVTKGYGAFLALNLLIMPGVNDLPQEIEALFQLIQEAQPDMIQLRNLNIDPDYYFHYFPPQGAGIGIGKMLELLKKEFPNLRLGNSTPAAK
jgi:wyosine [tRNA(Phe)-imidazoG37] synthetase (radical SAM superfamily)